MSETIKTGDGPRKPQDQAARAIQLVNEAAGKAAKESSASVAVMGGAAEQFASSVKEAVRAGLEVSADAGARAANLAQEEKSRLQASTAQAANVYGDVTARSAERVQAFMSSAMTLTRGLQQMQQVWIEVLGNSMEQAAHGRQDLLRCKSLTDIAEVQCDLCRNAINRAFETSNRMLELAGHVTQEAMRPLRTGTH